MSRRAPFALVLPLLLVLGCSEAGDTPLPPPADAAALEALAAERVPSTLPVSTQTVDDAVEALVAGQPAAEAVGDLDVAAVGEALSFTARLVAATRADRDYLCGPREASPARPLSSVALRDQLADDDVRAGVEKTIGSVVDRDDCGDLTWVGPGVVVGLAEWTVLPPGPEDVQPDTELVVDVSGTYGYALASVAGVPEPWGQTARNRYELRRAGGRWTLNSWSGFFGSLQQSWPDSLPLPDGYAVAPSAPVPDPASLEALRLAATAFAQADGAEATTVARIEGAPGRADGPLEDGARADYVKVLAPTRGDGTSTATAAGETFTTLYLDGGLTELDAVEDPADLVAAPGVTLPSPVAWVRRTVTTGSTNGGYPFGTYRLVGLLTAADAAAPATCPEGSPAARCYTALLDTSQDDDPLTSQFVRSRVTAAQPFLLVRVGLDEQGRPVTIDSGWPQTFYGEPNIVLVGTTVLRYVAAPPPLTLPDPATVVPESDLDER